MIQRIWALAVNTAREAVRSKLLYTLLFFAILVILLGVGLAAISYVERERIFQDFGIASIRLFSIAIAIFVGVDLIHKEVERRTVYTILSKPLSRAEFLLGKYLGLMITLWSLTAFMVAFFVALSTFAGAPQGLGHLFAYLLVALELAVIVAVATLFSSFTTPMLASFFTCGIWAVGHLTRDMRDQAAHADPVVRTAAAWLHRTLPDLETFNLSIQASHQLPVAASDLWLPGIYGAGYVAILLVAAVAIFERRNFR